MEDIYNLELIEYKTRVRCARECVAWYIDNLSEEKIKILNDNLVKVICKSIILDNVMFYLWVFQKLKLIDIDFENRKLIYIEDEINYNVNNGRFENDN